jgi:acylphosphatase
MPKVCKHFYVSGRVQNVFFRDSTRKKAQELSLCGWVRNLADRRVEVLACGDEENVKALAKWLWQGPPAAKVTEVLETDHEIIDHAEFSIKYDD